MFANLQNEMPSCVRRVIVIGLIGCDICRTYSSTRTLDTNDFRRFRPLTAFLSKSSKPTRLRRDLLAIALTSLFDQTNKPKE